MNTADPMINRIKQLKKNNKITTAELADLANVPKGTLTKILSGEIKDAKMKTIKSIASALNTSVDYLVYGDDVSPTRAANSNETQLLTMYRKLNSEDQKLLLNYANTLILAEEAAGAINKSSELLA